MSLPIEIVNVETSKIACDGDKESAHPRVYLIMGAQGFVDCPYCGKHYVLNQSAAKSATH